MKKNIALALVLLLLLTACHAAQDNDNDQAGSTSFSSSVIPSSNIPSSSVTPSSSVAPPTSIPATSVPATEELQSPYDVGYAHIHKGSNPYLNIDPDFSDCTVEYLYWIELATEKVFPVCEEPVIDVVQSKTYIYYVKAAEPTKIYATPYTDFTQHEMIYECSHGAVSAMTIDTFTIRTQTILQFVADNKKFVVLDLETGEDTVLMEQYYIQEGLLDSGPTTDTWQEQNQIFFVGQPTENDKLWDYRYYRDTGKVVEENDCVD